MTKVEVTRSQHSGYRSLFWPMLLIGIGVIWFLGNMNILSFENILVLARLWPLVLIIIGVDMLFGRRSPALGALIGIGTIVALVVLMLAGPALGLGYDVEITDLANSEPLGDAQSAQIILESGTGEVRVAPLSDSANLIDFNIHSIGEVDYQVSSSGTQKTIQLKQAETSGFDGFAGFLAAVFQKGDDLLLWNVQLSPQTPLDLNISSGTGALNLDLSELQITRLNASVGTGSMELTLPTGESSYPVVLSTGTGSGTITIPQDAALDIQVSSGTGSFTINLPENSGVRLVASTGTGSINVPAFLKRLGSEKDQFTGDSGTWETDNYANADRKISIHYEGGTGSLNVR